MGSPSISATSRSVRSSLLGLISLIGLISASTLPSVVPLASAQATIESAPSLAGILPDLVERVHPAVVQVITTRFGPRPGDPSSYLGQQTTTGAGVIVGSDGYILTNHHVVDGARRVQVMLSAPRSIGTDPRSVLKPRGERIGAQVVGSDLETDIALLKIDRSDLPTLELANSEAVRQGQLVFAFGSPLGLAGSVSMGVVSAVARQLADTDPMIYIQSDAAVNPGNSGGPLVDAKGRVIGLNTFILTQSGGSEGLSFAVPSNIVRTVYDQIRSTGRVRRGVIGATAQTLNPLLAQGLGIDRDWGVLIGDVAPGGPAARAGLKSGDVVVSLDGKLMENARQFSVNLYGKPIAEPVTLQILRDGSPRELRVDIIERAGDPQRFADLVNPREARVDRLGMLGIDLDHDLVAMFGGTLRSDQGVVVAGVLFNLSNVGGGLQPGDVIRSVNGRSIDSVEDLRRSLTKLTVGRAVVLQVERFGQFLYLAFQLDS